MALHGAVEGGHLPAVKLLLDNGADVNFKIEDGRSPLHRAARLGHGSLVQLLLDRGA
ncbi:ankyrin repeat-containing domain protein, partial [Baffinella frigidus]